MDIDKVKEAVEIAKDILPHIEGERDEAHFKVYAVQVRALHDLIEVAQSVIDGTIFASEEEIRAIVEPLMHLQNCVKEVRQQRIGEVFHALSHKLPSQKMMSEEGIRRIAQSLFDAKCKGGDEDVVGIDVEDIVKAFSGRIPEREKKLTPEQEDYLAMAEHFSGKKRTSEEIIKSVYPETEFCECPRPTIGINPKYCCYCGKKIENKIPAPSSALTREKLVGIMNNPPEIEYGVGSNKIKAWVVIKPEALSDAILHSLGQGEKEME